MATNWRSYGLSQSRGSLPTGPVTVMVHMASVWVPFTSESKEAIASYDAIEKELRLALQAVGRKLGMFLRRRKSIKQEGERRSIFLRYLGEVATAVSDINGTNREQLYGQLLKVAQRKTKEADTKLDKRGKKMDEDELYGDNVLIVDSAPDLAAKLNNGSTGNDTVQKELFDEDAEETTADSSSKSKSNGTKARKKVVRKKRKKKNVKKKTAKRKARKK